MRLSFFLEEIKDQPYVRDNFKRLQKQIDQEPLFKGDFKFFSIPVPAAGTHLKFKHNLSYRPKDVIFLSASNSSDITFHYDLFNSNDIDFTATAACTFRCFIGLYAEELLR